MSDSGIDQEDSGSLDRGREDGTGNVPSDFPVAIVLFDEDKLILDSNNIFDDLFYNGSSNDVFRSRCDQRFVLSALLSDLETDYLPVDQRREVGRVDYFYQWDEFSQRKRKPLRLCYPRVTDDMDPESEEYVASMQEDFCKERYFRFWTRKRNAKTTEGKTLYISAVVDVTESEAQRRDAEEAEKQYTKKLSRTLIDNRMWRKGLFELRSMPKNGRNRAGGDFFFFWGMHSSSRIWPRWGGRRLVTCIFGDASEKAVLAASAVQQAATILVPFCSSPPNEYFISANPADYLINRLNKEAIETRLLTSGQFDGAVLVFDPASETLFFADGNPGGVFIVDPDIRSINVLWDPERDGAPGVSIGRSDSPKFRVGKKFLASNSILLGFTDGVRFALDRNAGDRPWEDHLSSIVAEALQSLDARVADWDATDDGVDKNAGETDIESEDEGTPEDEDPFCDARAAAIVKAIADVGGGDEQRDDELLFALSIRNLIKAAWM